jgi:predicted secreted Zn-dependent protease
MYQMFLAAVLSTAQFPSDAGPAQVPAGEALPDTLIRYYEVSGTNLAAINSGIATRAPRDPATGAAAPSSAEWSVALKVEEKTVDDRCVVTGAKSSFSASVTLPRLANADSAPNDLRKAWGQYLSNLTDTHAAELWFVVERLEQLEKAVIGRGCNEASRLAGAAAEIIQKDLAAFSRKIRKTPPSLKVHVGDPHDPR